MIKGISLLHFSRRLSTNLTLPQVGIDGASSHSGRRSLITNLASKGVGVRVLMSLAGHSNISTTQAYIDVNDEMQRAAIELVSGSTREAALVQYPSVFELSAIQSSLTF
ncbi:tyrosine-type recombinase/integrase [Paraburkholderia sp. 5N]|uniref:Tyrosine-type recombinase/integrase n=1 Tax=Paraburkholderia elongata TaxID=2675747 RepID=A0A972SPV5_9BURK|nr:tyrosine-type recombinase/integrase [Paraburkholderia elongata]